MDIRPFGTTQQGARPYADRLADMPARPAGAQQAAGTELPANVSPVQHAQAVHDEEQVTQALKSINELLQTRSPDLEFSLDRDSNRAIVRVVDKETQEVIRQMPSEDVLQIAKALDRLQSMLIRETA
jgi:flagellar protein FlaG